MWRDRMLGAGVVTVLLLMPLASRADDPPTPGSPGSFHLSFGKAKGTGEKPSFPELDKSLDGAVGGYMDGRAADAEAILNSFADTKKDKKSYPLYLLSLGSVGLSLGDYQGVERRLTEALASMNVELGTAATGLALFKSESDRPYRGYSHEKMLAHTYLGLAYFEQAKYEDARIEFAKAREVDHGQAAAQDGDFLTGHFLEGLTALRRQSYNDAQVSFRKVTELKQDWPLGWYALCRASELAHDDAEAGEAWARYDTLAPAEGRLARDGSTPCVLFMIDSGQGPVRKPDALTGELGSWEKSTSPEVAVVLTPKGQSAVEARAVDDLYFQASTAGGLAGEASRKVVSSALKAGVKGLLGGHATTPKSDVDVRCWAISPARVHLAAVPVSALPTTVELQSSLKAGVATGGVEGLLDRLDNALDKAIASPLGTNHQVYRFLRGQPFDQAPVVYERVIPNAGMRATLH